MLFREIDFHADGLKPNRIRELMGLMNAERKRASEVLEESVRNADDEADIFATIGVRHIRAISWQARDAGRGALKELAHSYGVVAAAGWFAAACAFALFVVAISGQHMGWKVFAGLPLFAGAGIAAVFFALCAKDSIHETAGVLPPLVTGRYPEEKVQEMVYRAGSAWALGREAIHVQASRPYQRIWKPELQQVRYTSIHSIEIHRLSGQISFKAGQDCFALFEVECPLRAEDIVMEIIRRARSMGHEIHRMNVRSKSMEGLGKSVPPDLLDRFARTLSGVKVIARDLGLESTLEVHMERADEVEMSRRVAEFEGFHVIYVVPHRQAA